MANFGAARTTFSGLVLIMLMWIAATGCSFVFSSTSGASAPRTAPSSDVIGDMGSPVADRVVPALESSVESSWLSRLSVHVSIAAACGLVLGLASIPAYGQQESGKDRPSEFLRLLRPPPQADTPYIENPGDMEEQAKWMIRAATENKIRGEQEARQTEKDRVAVIIDLKKAGEQAVEDMPPTGERSKASDALQAKWREELSRLAIEKQTALEKVEEQFRIDRQAATQMASDAKVSMTAQRKAKVAWKDEVGKQAVEDRAIAEDKARLDEQNAIKRVADMKRMEGEDILNLPLKERAAAEKDLQERARASLEEAKTVRIEAEQDAKAAAAQARQRAAGIMEKGPPVFAKIE